MVSVKLYLIGILCIHAWSVVQTKGIINELDVDGTNENLKAFRYPSRVQSKDQISNIVSEDEDLMKWEENEDLHRNLDQAKGKNIRHAHKHTHDKFESNALPADRRVENEVVIDILGKPSQHIPSFQLNKNGLTASEQEEVRQAQHLSETSYDDSYPVMDYNRDHHHHHKLHHHEKPKETTGASRQFAGYEGVDGKMEEENTFAGDVEHITDEDELKEEILTGNTPEGAIDQDRRSPMVEDMESSPKIKKNMETNIEPEILQFQQDINAKPEWRTKNFKAFKNIGGMETTIADSETPQTNNIQTSMDGFMKSPMEFENAALSYPQILNKKNMETNIDPETLQVQPDLNAKPEWHTENFKAFKNIGGMETTIADSEAPQTNNIKTSTNGFMKSPMEFENAALGVENNEEDSETLKEDSEKAMLESEDHDIMEQEDHNTHEGDTVTTNKLNIENNNNVEQEEMGRNAVEILQHQAEQENQQQDQTSPFANSELEETIGQHEKDEAIKDTENMGALSKADENTIKIQKTQDASQLIDSDEEAKVDAKQQVATEAEPNPSKRKSDLNAPYSIPSQSSHGDDNDDDNDEDDSDEDDDDSGNVKIVNNLQKMNASTYNNKTDNYPKTSDESANSTEASMKQFTQGDDNDNEDDDEDDEYENDSGIIKTIHNSSLNAVKSNESQTDDATEGTNRTSKSMLEEHRLDETKNSSTEDSIAIKTAVPVNEDKDSKGDKNGKSDEKKHNKDEKKHSGDDGDDDDNEDHNDNNDNYNDDDDDYKEEYNIHYEGHDNKDNANQNKNIRVEIHLNNETSTELYPIVKISNETHEKGYNESYRNSSGSKKLPTYVIHNATITAIHERGGNSESDEDDDDDVNESHIEIHDITGPQNVTYDIYNATIPILTHDKGLDYADDKEIKEMIDKANDKKEEELQRTDREREEHLTKLLQLYEQDNGSADDSGEKKTTKKTIETTTPLDTTAVGSKRDVQRIKTNAVHEEIPEKKRKQIIQKIEENFYPKNAETIQNNKQFQDIIKKMYNIHRLSKNIQLANQKETFGNWLKRRSHNRNYKAVRAGTTRKTVRQGSKSSKADKRVYIQPYIGKPRWRNNYQYFS